MPKVIENIRENILETAKQELMTEGYTGLSLRGVSRQCGVAVGTIYNYFPSKLALISAVIMEDWDKQTDKIKRSCADSNNIDSGLKSIYCHLRDFVVLYRDVWSMSINSKDVREELKNGQQRHQQLIEQLSFHIQTLFIRFDIVKDSFTVDFIARMLLVYVKEPDVDYEQLSKIIKKIL